MQLLLILSVAFFGLGSCAPLTPVLAQPERSVLLQRLHSESKIQGQLPPSILPRLYPARRPLSIVDILHKTVVTRDARKSAKPPFDKPVSADGDTPLEKVPPRAILGSDLLQEKVGSGGLSGGVMAVRLSRRLRDTASGLSDTDARAYCTTEECVRMMKEYDEWRKQNGYGTVAGRWG